MPRYAYLQAGPWLANVDPELNLFLLELEHKFAPISLKYTITRYADITGKSILEDCTSLTPIVKEDVGQPLIEGVWGEGNLNIRAVPPTHRIIQDQIGCELQQAINEQLLQQVMHKGAWYITLGEQGGRRVLTALDRAVPKPVPPRPQTPVPELMSVDINGGTTMPGLPVMESPGVWTDIVTGMITLPPDEPQGTPKEPEQHRGFSTSHTQAYAFPVVSLDDLETEQRRSTPEERKNAKTLRRILDRAASKSLIYGTLKRTNTLVNVLPGNKKEFVDFGSKPLYVADPASDMWEKRFTRENNNKIYAKYTQQKPNKPQPTGLKRMGTGILNMLGQQEDCEEYKILSFACIPMGLWNKDRSFSPDVRSGKGSAHFALNAIIESDKDVERARQVIRQTPQAIVLALNGFKVTCQDGQRIDLSEHYKLNEGEYEVVLL